MKKSDDFLAELLRMHEGNIHRHNDELDKLLERLKLPSTGEQLKMVKKHLLKRKSKLYITSGFEDWQGLSNDLKDLDVELNELIQTKYNLLQTRYSDVLNLIETITPSDESAHPEQINSNIQQLREKYEWCKGLHLDLKPNLEISFDSLIHLIEHGSVIPGDKPSPTWKGKKTDATRFAMWLTPSMDHELEKFNDNIKLKDGTKLVAGNKTKEVQKGSISDVLKKYRDMPEHGKPKIGK